MSWRALLEAARAEASGERALATVRALATFHRVQASPGYDAAAAWLGRALESIGLAPEIEHVAGDGRTRRGVVMPEGWECDRARATLIAGAERRTLCDYDAVKLSLVLRSESARGRWPLVALADGAALADPAPDVRGRVVLTRDPVHRVAERLVHAGGAAGILCDGRRLVHPVRGPDDDPEQVAYTSFWWAGDQPRAWGFVVSPAEGTRLRERLARGEALELDVEIASRRFATPIPLVSARIAGDTDEEVLVLAHLCHPQPSANDNASGAAAALETARTLLALRARGAWTPRRGVRFLWMPELTGTHAWLAADPARARRTVAALNLDMVGEDQDQCGSTMLVEHPPWFLASFAAPLVAEIRDHALDWVESYSGPGHFAMTRTAEVPYSGGSDHAALLDPEAGVPCPMLIQWPDRYYHSSHDTPDRTDPRSLALAVRTASTYAGWLASVGEDDHHTLIGLVTRRALRTMLRAAGDGDGARTVTRAYAAGERALASLARLGVAEGRLTKARKRLENEFATEHVATEYDWGSLGYATRVRANSAMANEGDDLGGKDPVPIRRPGARPDFHPHLLPGWESLSIAERRTARDFFASIPGGTTTVDLAWFACDGRRGCSAIALAVWLETGVLAIETVAELFEWTARLGLTDWAKRAAAPSTL